jgi:hypothetical protein
MTSSEVEESGSESSNNFLIPASLISPSSLLRSDSISAHSAINRLRLFACCIFETFSGARTGKFFLIPRIKLIVTHHPESVTKMGNSTGFLRARSNIRADLKRYTGSRKTLFQIEECNKTSIKLREFGLSDPVSHFVGHTDQNFYDFFSKNEQI